MSKYFKYFPLQQYDYYGDGVKSPVVDIFRMVAVDSIKIDDIVSYTYYEVKNGERPDVASQNLYGTPDYHWTFFVLNPSLRAGMGAWYKDDHVMEKFLTQKYDPYFALEFKRVQTGPLELTAEIPVIDESGNDTIYTETVTATENRGTLSGLDYSEITLGLKITTDGYVGHVFPIAETDTNRAQLIFRRDGITKVNVVDSGKDYVIAPSMTIISESGYGTGAKLEASISRGSISSIRVADQGYGYTRESYQVLVKNTPVEEAKIAATVDGSGVVRLSFVARPSYGTGSPELNDGELYYRGKGYVKRPTLVVSPPAAGGTTAKFEVSIDANTGRLSSSLSGSTPSLVYRVVTAGVGYVQGETVYVRLVDEEDSLSMAVAVPPPEDMFSSGALTQGPLSLVPINPYLTSESGYTAAQATIDNWINTTFYDWAIATLQISYYNYWLQLDPSEILVDTNMSITPYRSWSSLRYAPHTYYNTAGKKLTVEEAQTISSQTYDTFANYETALNESNRNIRVVRPENIMEFTEEYRKILKS